MNTPTPEQLQEFKDFYNTTHEQFITKHFDEYAWLMVYNDYTAYANQVLMKPVMEKGKFYPQNHETMLMGQIAALQEQNTNLLGKLATTEQNLAISQERVKELEDELSTAKERIDYLLSL